MKKTWMFKLTNDDWYPNYEGNRVKLKYIGLLSDGTYRVAVWGGDDFGFEKDFEKEEDAISTFKRLENYPIINHQHLKDLNFRYV